MVVRWGVGGCEMGEYLGERLAMISVLDIGCNVRIGYIQQDNGNRFLMARIEGGEGDGGDPCEEVGPSSELVGWFQLIWRCHRMTAGRPPGRAQRLFSVRGP